jgi:hypothetical protein
MHKIMLKYPLRIMFMFCRKQCPIPCRLVHLKKLD